MELAILSKVQIINIWLFNELTTFKNVCISSFKKFEESNMHTLVNVANVFQQIIKKNIISMT